LPDPWRAAGVVVGWWPPWRKGGGWNMDDQTAASRTAGEPLPHAGPGEGLSGPYADERAGWWPVARDGVPELVAAFVRARAVARRLVAVTTGGRCPLRLLRQRLGAAGVSVAPGVDRAGRPVLRLVRCGTAHGRRSERPAGLRKGAGPRGAATLFRPR
jgi:hypothetical protein